MKKTKKLFIAFLTFAMLMGMTTVCFAAGTTLPTGTWSVNFVVNGVTHKVTSADVAKLTPYTVAATYTNNSGTTTTAYFTGVRIKDVLKSIGVTDVTTVKAETSDSYATDPYNKATAMNENTLLAWGKGKTADSIEAIDLKGNSSYNPVMLIPGGSNLQGQQFIKYVASVTVTGATLAKTSTSTSTKASTKTTTAAAATTTASNPKTGDSTPVSAEVILLAMASMLAVAATAIGMKKSLNRK